MGNLYRVLRALEEDGLVELALGSGASPGPAKRIYELTRGRRSACLEEWADALRSRSRERIDKLSSIVTRGGETMHHRTQKASPRASASSWYDRESVLERLENYQRDLEQELADVSDLITRLTRRRGPGQASAANADAC